MKPLQIAILVICFQGQSQTEKVLGAKEALLKGIYYDHYDFNIPKDTTIIYVDGIRSNSKEIDKHNIKSMIITTDSTKTICTNPRIKKSGVVFDSETFKKDKNILQNEKFKNPSSHF